MSVTIRVKPGTRDYLRDISVEKETYDDVINRLIMEHAKMRDELRAWREFERLCEEDEDQMKCKQTREPCDPESYYCHLLQNTSKKIQNKGCERLIPEKEAEGR